MSAAIIDGGMASPGLLSWILTGKYLDHLPLYRLEQIAARDRVPLPRSNLAERVGRSAVALQPLAERLREHLLEHPVLHTDETPVQQLDPGNGRTRRAYLRAYRRNSLGEGAADHACSTTRPAVPAAMPVPSWPTGKAT